MTVDAVYLVDSICVEILNMGMAGIAGFNLTSFAAALLLFAGSAFLGISAV
jgi:hypothetical protein